MKLHLGSKSIPFLPRSFTLLKMLLAAACVILAASPASAAPLAQATTGSISGRITSLGYGTPIAGALVVAKNMASTVTYSTSTLSDGTYTIADLPPDFYCITASADGYYTRTTGYPGTVYYQVRAGSAQNNINLALPEPTSVSGYVYELDGVTPIEGATVEIGIHSDLTDSNGYFTISDLISGNGFYARASANDHIDQYYLNAENFEEATPFSAPRPGDAADIIFTLAKTGSISGVLKGGSAGEPMSGTITAIFYRGSQRETRMRRASEYDGTFTVNGLPPGNVILMASANTYLTRYYPNAETEAAATPINLSNGQALTDIEMTLPTLGVISGHVYKEDGVTPLNNAIVTITPVGSNEGTELRTHADGAYTSYYTFAPGSYIADARWGAYPKKYYLNTADRDHATPIVIEPNSDVSNIDFILTPPGGISGQIFKPDGTPAENGTVGFYTQDGHPIGWTTVDAEGRYTYNELPTGQYIVRSYGALNCPAKFYPNAFRLTDAQPVQVTEPNITPDINITLSTGGWISGHVYYSDGVTPVANAYVSVNPVSTDDPNDYYYVPADENGYYFYNSLPSGNFNVEVWGEHFLSEYYRESPDYSHRTPVAVALGQETSGIDFTVNRSYGIRIGSNRGGTVIFTGRNILTMTIPAWDHLDSVIIGISELDPDLPLPWGYRVVGEPYNIFARHDSGNSTDNLGQPVTLTIDYPPLDPAEFSLQRVGFYRYTDDGAWELEPCTVNAQARQIVCQMMYFGRFALLSRYQLPIYLPFTARN